MFCLCKCVSGVKGHLWCRVSSDMPGMKAVPMLGKVGRPSATMGQQHRGQVAAALSLCPSDTPEAFSSVFYQITLLLHCV